jgi:hypothetical protein
VNEALQSESGGDMRFLQAQQTAVRRSEKSEDTIYVIKETWYGRNQLNYDYFVASNKEWSRTPNDTTATGHQEIADAYYKGEQTNLQESL